MSKIHRIRIVLNLKQNNELFQAVVRSDIQRDEISLPIYLTIDDLKNINNDLTNALTNLMRTIKTKINYEGKIFRSAKNLIQKEFRAMAERGSVALYDVFGEKGLGLLKELMGGASEVILDIVSGSFIIPWELLYDDFKPNRLEYENFWGFKYIIYRHFPPDYGLDSPNPEILTSPISVGLLADQELPSVADLEIPFLEELEEKKSIKLNKLSVQLRPSKRDRLFQTELKHFFSQEMHIVHFACHTREPIARFLEPPDEYLLLLSRDFPISRSDFINYKLSFGDNPLVILNACGTNPRNPFATRNTVREFLKRNARGVISTECPVPDPHAAAFTQKFYPLLVAGKELGDALLETRRSLLAHPYNNPLGLLYALYASPETRFITNG